MGEKKKKQHSLTSLKVWRLYPRYTQVGQCAVTFFSCTHFEDHSSIFVWNKFRHRTSLRIFRINLKYLNADLCLYHNFHYSTEDMLTYKSLNKFIMPSKFCIFKISIYYNSRLWSQCTRSCVGSNSIDENVRLNICIAIILKSLE